MWMVDPALLCRKHLLGEHNELHKFLPSFRKGYSVAGRFSPVVQIQFKKYLERHNDLVDEMLARGYKHNSPLEDIPDFNELYPVYFNQLVDIDKSYKDLCDRCSRCKRRIYHRFRMKE